MNNTERIVWITIVLVLLAVGAWLQRGPDEPKRKPVDSPDATSIQAKCGVAAGGMLSSRELAITCGLDDAGVEAVIAKAIVDLDLDQLAKQVHQGDAELPGAVDELALRLGLTREVVIALLGHLGSDRPEERLTPDKFARSLARGEPLVVVRVVSTVARQPNTDRGSGDTPATSPSQDASTSGPAQQGLDAEGPPDEQQAVVAEGRRLQVECGVVAGKGIEVDVSRIACGPEQEEIDAIIDRLVAKARIGDLVEELRRGSLAQIRLLDDFEKELHLSRTTALALLKQIADSNLKPDQAAVEFGELTRQHVHLAYRIGQLPAEDPDATELRDLTAAAVARGEFATAQRLLRQHEELQQAKDQLAALQDDMEGLNSEIATLQEDRDRLAAAQPTSEDQAAEPKAEAPGTEEPPTLFVSQDRVELRSPARVSAGAPVALDWRGPAAPGDLIFIAPTDRADNMYPRSDRQRHNADKGSPAVLNAPAQPGEYEIRYFSYANGAPLARIPLEVTTAEVKFAAPDSSPAGSVIEFDWGGPNAPDDLLFIVEPSLGKDRYLSSDRQHHATRRGSPATLVSPAEPGSYEIRYFSYDNGTTLFAKPLDVTAPEVSFAAPVTVAPGAHLRFSWEGPNAPGDLIFIVRPDLENNLYITTDRNRHRTTQGPIAELVAPAEAGEYEIRYFSYANGSVLSAAALTVE